MPNALAELLAGAVPLYEGDYDALVEWAEDVQAADAKLLPGAGFGMDTTGVTIDVQDRVGEDADVEVGTFQEGWIATPGQSNGDCPECEESPIVALSNKERGIILLDCLGCRTRYDIHALDGESDE